LITSEYGAKKAAQSSVDLVWREYSSEPIARSLDNGR
jgi:hypothetical protein